MAQFSLRNAYVRFKDGYSLIGAVNNVGNYPIGATTMIVDGFTTAVVTGDPFTIVGDITVYTITAHAETTGATTSITFTPGLVVAANNNTVINVGPHFITVKVGDGTVTYTEKRKIEYVRDRGRISEVRIGDDEPLEVRLDFIWEFIKAQSGDPPTVEDVLKNRGNASSWVTSSNDVCQPYSVDIEIEYDPPCATEMREIITLADFRYEDLGHELKNGVVTVSGHCNIVEAAVARAA